MSCNILFPDQIRAQDDDCIEKTTAESTYEVGEEITFQIQINCEFQTFSIVDKLDDRLVVTDPGDFNYNESEHKLTGPTLGHSGKTFSFKAMVPDSAINEYCDVPSIENCATVSGQKPVIGPGEEYESYEETDCTTIFISATDPILTLTGQNYVSDLIDNGTLQPTTVDQNLKIDGTLIVDTDWQLGVTLPTNGYENDVVLTGGSEIIVVGDAANQESVKFSANGTRFYSCYNLWKGIELSNSFSNIQFQNTQIENAHIAVELFLGADISLQSIDFENNYIGIYFKGQEVVLPSALFHFLFKVKFVQTEALLPHWDIADFNQDAYVGILADLHPGLNLTSYKGINKLWPISFKNLANGIIAKYSNIHCQDVLFKNIQRSDETFDMSTVDGINTSFEGKGIRMYGNEMNNLTVISEYDLNKDHFLDVHTGIQTDFANLRVTDIEMNKINNGIRFDDSHSRMVEIADNHLENIYYYGLQGNNSTEMLNLNIKDNYFEDEETLTGHNPLVCIVLNNLTAADPLNDLKFRSNDIDVHSADHGLYALNTRDMLVKNNSIEINLNQSDASSFVYQQGFIFVDNYKLRVHKNTAYKTGTGEEMWSFTMRMNECLDMNCNQSDLNDGGQNDHGPDRGFVFSSVNTNTEFARNRMYDHYDMGLLLQENAVIGPQDNHGNEFYGVFHNLAAKHLGQPFSSPFHNPDNVNPFDLPDVLVEPDLIWFIDNIDPQDLPLTCEEFINMDPPCGRETVMDSLIAEEFYSFPEWNEAKNWYIDRHYFGKYEENPGLRNSEPYLEDYYNQLDTGTHHPAIYDAEYSIRHLADWNQTDADSFRSKYDQLSTALDSLGTIQGNLSDTTLSAAEMEDQDSLRQEVWQEVVALDSVMDHLDSVHHADIETAINQSQSTVASLPATDTFESKLKYALQQQLLYMDSVYTGNDPGGVDSTWLEAIEEDCHLEVGPAKMRAMSLLTTMTDSVYLWEENCQTPPSRISKTRPVPALTVYPNPSVHSSVVRWNEELKKQALLQIIDLNGQVLREIPVQKGEQKSRIQNGQLKGAYLIRLLEDGQVQGRAKWFVH